MKPLLSAAFIAAPLFALPTLGQFIPGRLAVLRVGDGSASLSSAAAAVTIEQYSITGIDQSPSFAVSLPATGALAITLSGTASSEGALARSANGRYLTFGGFNAEVGTAGVAGTPAENVNRAVGLLDAAGIYSLPVKSSTAFSGSDVRSAVTGDGTQFWMSGNGSGSTGGIWAESGATESHIYSAVSNLRVLNLIDGNLVVSTGAGTATRGVHAFSGLPETAALPSQLFNAGSSASPYDFALNPAGNVVYLADDRSTANGGGIQRWERAGDTWSLSYTLASGGNAGARGLAADWTGLDPVLFAITAETTANRLIRIEDTGAGAAAVTLATASPDTLFRGVDFSPIPEPQTYALLAWGGAGWLLLVRRRA